MTFRLQGFLKIGVTTKEAAINLVAELAYNAGTVQQTSLEAQAKLYFHAFYTLDKTCSDWAAVNKQYTLV
ncbi:hypothetical protein QNI16_19620 [Cytophagaceae bacterium YF14B1]|uniref:Uncharacterized protein n=1 Tax=Xanthocytophaga flava TaxID=3048013 RepID=A0AAE3UAE7_9BACT|nr:hypothetical protein [Xanthocytophaga flavus]MDJ1482719.1 hypothetical protein [Xanthocytophaga flavus]